MGGVVPESHLNGSELIDYESLVELDEDMAQVVTNFLTKTNDSGIQNGYDSKSVELDRYVGCFHYPSPRKNELFFTDAPIQIPFHIYFFLRLSDHLHSDSNHDHHPLLTSIGSFLLPSPQPPDSTSVLLEQDPRHQQQLTNQVKGKIFEIKEYWMQLPDFKIIESLRQSASKSAAASQCPLWKKLTRLNLPPWVDEMSKYSAFMDVVVGAS